jgi:hypothetical protein
MTLLLRYNYNYIRITRKTKKDVGFTVDPLLENWYIVWKIFQTNSATPNRQRPPTFINSINIPELLV